MGGGGLGPPLPPPGPLPRWERGEVRYSRRKASSPAKPRGSGGGGIMSLGGGDVRPLLLMIAAAADVLIWGTPGPPSPTSGCWLSEVSRLRLSAVWARSSFSISSLSSRSCKKMKFMKALLTTCVKNKSAHLSPEFLHGLLVHVSLWHPGQCIDGGGVIVAVAGVDVGITHGVVIPAGLELKMSHFYAMG